MRSLSPILIKGWQALRARFPNDPIVLGIFAGIVGVAVGYAAIGFRHALALVQTVAFGFPGEALASGAAALDWWHVLLAPAVGGLVIGLVLQFLVRGKRPQGVAQVIEAGALQGGRMPFRQGLLAAAINAASLGFGASTGREGPIVHLGAVIGSSAARRLNLSHSTTLTLLGCGVASGVAASFNAPIAGVFFALEVVIGHYALNAFAPVVIASVAGTMVSRIHLGDFPAFVLPHYEIVSLWEFPAFALLGAVSGLAAIIFIRSTMLAEDVVERIEAPIFLQPAAGGLLVGAIAVFFPEVLGVGYEATDAALKEKYTLLTLFALIAAKMTATAVSLGCRFGGGVFSPSLFLGAMVGGAFGIIAAGVFPELAASHGLYAIVGMGAVAAAVLGAPISTILIVFELTGDYRVTIAVMVAAVMAAILTQRFAGRSFFHSQLNRRGINLRGGRPQNLLRQQRVSDLMSNRFETVANDLGVQALRTRLLLSTFGTFFVVDGEGRLIGRLTFEDLKNAVFDPALEDVIKADDICRRNAVVVTASDNVDHALTLLEASGEDLVAVVDSRERMRIVGVLFHKDLLLAHNRALLQVHAEEHGFR